jgi:hypothetical protein
VNDTEPSPDIRRAIAWDCADIINRFFTRLDERDYAGMQELVSPDLSWLRQGKLLRGRDDLMRALQARSPTYVIRHIVSNAVFDAQSVDRAEGGFYLTVVRYDDGRPVEGPAPLAGIALVSVYKARFALLAEGWRIAALSSTVAFDCSVQRKSG